MIKRIPFNTRYDIFVSTEGKVYRDLGDSFKEYSPKICKKGYHRVGLVMPDGNRKTFAIHRLIAMTFIPTDGMNELQINHINGIKSDNRLPNLEWCDNTYNQYHAIDTGLKDVKVSKDMLFAILSRYHDCLDTRKVASEFGISYKEVGRYLRKDRKRRWIEEFYELNPELPEYKDIPKEYKIRRKESKFEKELIFKALDLNAQGYSLSAISKETGISEGFLYAIIHKNSLRDLVREYENRDSSSL